MTNVNFPLVNLSVKEGAVGGRGLPIKDEEFKDHQQELAEPESGGFEQLVHWKC